MNTAMSKTNFIKSQINLYSWLLNTIETPYQRHSASGYKRYLREQGLFLG